MIRIWIFLSGVSFFVFLYGILKLYFSKERAIERLQQHYLEEAMDPNHIKLKRQENKVAVKLLAQGFKKSKRLTGYLDKKRFILRKAYLEITIEEFLAIKIVAILLLNLFFFLLSSNITLNIFLGFVFVILGWTLPDVYIGILIEKRKKQLNRQLCDGLKIISNALKAGQGFFQALKTMVEEVEGPLSQEFGLMLKELKLGVSLEDALENMTQRMESEDLKFVATAVLIQRESGGNLAEILESIAETIKGRIQLYRELMAASAQGKISATILALIPVALTFYVLLVNRQTHGVLITETAGIAMLVLAGGMELLGIYFIKKILKIKF
jgi:tight adherence protein B